MRGETAVITTSSLRGQLGRTAEAAWCLQSRIYSSAGCPRPLPLGLTPVSFRSTCPLFCALHSLPCPGDAQGWIACMRRDPARLRNHWHQPLNGPGLQGVISRWQAGRQAPRRCPVPLLACPDNAVTLAVAGLSSYLLPPITINQLIIIIIIKPHCSISGTLTGRVSEGCSW